MPHFTTSDGLNLYYTDEGEGLPILCLAGLTRNTSDFEYVAPHLAGNRVIMMDYRGRGQSDYDDNWQNYTPPIECRDVLELMAHLSLDKVAILGTSRGGMNGMALSAMAKDRLLGVALNDVGPVVDPRGLEFIMVYLGRNPASKTFEEAAAALQFVYSDFDDVSPMRWLRMAQANYTQTAEGLQIMYDPKLRDAIEAVMAGPPLDLWPFFDAMAGLPLACIRGANSNLFTPDTLSVMQRRRPDMITAIVPGRGHVPFLDEPEAVAALHTWLEQMK